MKCYVFLFLFCITLTESIPSYGEENTTVIITQIEYEVSFITAFVEWFKIAYNYTYVSYEFLYWSIYYLYKEINPDCSNYKPAMI